MNEELNDKLAVFKELLGNLRYEDFPKAMEIVKAEILQRKFDNFIHEPCNNRREGENDLTKTT